MFLHNSRFCESPFILRVENAPIWYIGALPAPVTLEREEGAGIHKDPFGRILVCQASAEKMLLVTHDARIGEYLEPCVFVV